MAPFLFAKTQRTAVTAQNGLCAIFRLGQAHAHPQLLLARVHRV